MFATAVISRELADSIDLGELQSLIQSRLSAALAISVEAMAKELINGAGSIVPPKGILSEGAGLA